MCAASGTRTRTAITGQGILSPSCLPIPPLRQVPKTVLQRPLRLYANGEPKRRLCVLFFAKIVLIIRTANEFTEFNIKPAHLMPTPSQAVPEEVIKRILREPGRYTKSHKTFPSD